MGKEIKYYYVKTKDTFFNRNPELIRWSDDSYITMNEEVDYSQSIGIAVYKSLGEKFEKPKSTQYEVVRPILKEIFFDHFNLAVKLLSKKVIDEGEFYILKYKKDWIKVHGYTPAKMHILINFMDSLEYLDLNISSSYGHKDRPNCRKEGTLITKEQFTLILRLTLKFLYDPDSYKILLDSFLKDYYTLAVEGQEIEDLMLSTNHSFSSITEQLELRKKNIEKRLIEVDTDSELERIKLRGEIEGLNYALTTIKIHAQSS
jgi:hypothetical protein